MARGKRPGQGRKSAKHKKGETDEFEPVEAGEGDEFEPVEGEEAEDEKAVEEFEPVDEAKEEDFEPVTGEEAEEAFEPIDEGPPIEIKGSGMKTKGGEVDGYEPTLEEILAYATGKTKRPTEPPPPKKDTTQDLARILMRSRQPAGKEPGKGKKGAGGKAKKDEEEDDPLGALFDDEAKKD